MNETAPASDSGDDTPETTARRRFPVGALILLLLAIAVGGWAAYVWATDVDDGFDFRRFAFLGEYNPELYAAAGDVRFNGEPLDHGNLEAWPVSGRGPERMIAPIKDDGTFEFFSELNGKLSPGLPAGEYNVRLLVYDGGPGYSNTPTLPPEYYDFSTTPVSITVAAEPDGNHFVIEESGELPSTTEEAGGEAQPENDEPADDETGQSPE